MVGAIDMTADQARRTRNELALLTDRLVKEFGDSPPGRVMAAVALCRYQLAHAGVQGEGLLLATEAMARARMSLAMAC